MSSDFIIIDVVTQIHIAAILSQEREYDKCARFWWSLVINHQFPIQGILVTSIAVMFICKAYTAVNYHAFVSLLTKVIGLSTAIYFYLFFFFIKDA